MFSSDIGHWDVVDIREVTAEAYEMVENGRLNEDEFREFMFANAVRMWGWVNPDFFRGTVIESEAANALKEIGPKSRNLGVGADASAVVAK